MTEGMRKDLDINLCSAPLPPHIKHTQCQKCIILCLHLRVGAQATDGKHNKKPDCLPQTSSMGFMSGAQNTLRFNTFCSAAFLEAVP